MPGEPLSRRRLLRAAAVLVGAGTVGGSAALVVRDRYWPAPTPRSARPDPSVPEGAVGSQVLWRLPDATKQVVLTFDDGPDPRWTPRILDLLAEHDAAATFFVIGRHAQRHPGLLRRIAAAGHEIGNHTWSHSRVDQLTFPKVMHELRRTHETIGSITGTAPTLFRPPWGDLDSVGLLAAAEFGYRVVLWSDLIRGSSPEHDLTQLWTRLRPGGIILGHDGGPTPNNRLITAFRKAVDRLADEGYALPTMEKALTGRGRPG